ncbi:inhibitory synaptic factor 1-like [Cyprinus carpio]|uniref:Inhibitory synaptic factor 1 n=2 Tax=Cyprinus carpio TaxID=7962 RepID=A0A9Q9XCL6_CYPCA|nr:inhibitory synaptic factor 1-like [Cyprinus carpio]XP_042599356.1 inhibitory synaptic factor 1-like [Cyprinus carpio]XP_042599357.1 inhibitory synaptic factor 1-like [Cyprinus carpio]
MSQSGAPAREPSETPSQREQIRSHMKMVIEQLEGILKELKDVAHELREVVGQIDKLTSDIDFDLEPDDWMVATASSTSSSERGLGEAFRLDFLSQDMLSDGWDFCNFLEASNRKAQREDTDEGQGRPSSSTASVYSQMNGGLPVPNGPLIITPDSSSEEASSSTHSQKTRERVRFSDKILYHALCCDDDEDEEEDGGADEDNKGDCGTPNIDSVPNPLTCPPAEHPPGVYNCRETASAGPSPVKMPVMGSHTLPRKGLLNPQKLLRNSSTQTVSDKSTQTVLPYVPAKQKNKDL